MRIAKLEIVGLFLAIVSMMALWPLNADFGSPNTAWAQETDDAANPFGKSTDASDAPKTIRKAAVKKAQPESAKAEQAKVVPKKAGPRHSANTLKAHQLRDTLESITNLEYVEIPFIDVKRELEDKYGFNIVLDQSAIDDSLTDEELVTVRLRDISLSNALRLMLRNFNATYVVQDGFIKIISIDNAGDPFFFSQRMINVRSLLGLIRQRDSRLAESQPPPEGKTALNPERMLIEAITTIVGPDQWASSGQGEATIQVIGGVLVMSGPDYLLNGVSNFIHDLNLELSEN